MIFSAKRDCFSTKVLLVEVNCCGSYCWWAGSIAEVIRGVRDLVVPIALVVDDWT